MGEDTKIGVVGSRGYDDYPQFEEKLLHLVQNLTPPLKFISGGCKTGADNLVKQFCEIHGHELTEHLPDWSLGKRGAIVRNQLIINDSDYLAAWWDGKSKGTESSIKFAEKKGIKVKIIKI